MDERPADEWSGPDPVAGEGLPPADPPPPPPAEPPAVIPWEDAAKPWTAGLVETIRLLTARPRAAFERVPAGGDVLRPILFAILLGTVGQLFTGLWELTVHQVLFEAFPGTPWGQGLGSSRMQVVVVTLFAPLICALAVLITAVATHLALLLVGGAHSGFAATLRVVSYAQAASLALVLPFCGAWIYLAWSIVLEVIGLATLHRTSLGRATAAVLIPFLVCCGCILTAFALFGAAILAGIQGAAR